MLFITGGGGFIGSNFIIKCLNEGSKIINLDKFGVGHDPNNLREYEDHPCYTSVRGDIRDDQLVTDLLFKYRPKSVVHFAAESHVDRSLQSPEHFADNNAIGTLKFMTSCNEFYRRLNKTERSEFKVINVSTDEVYGSLNKTELAFVESSSIKPSSPYSASKASADAFAHAMSVSYGLPVITTHCSNNFGPRQHKEKFVPTCIFSLALGQKIPIYGNGSNIRDWLHVDDHCRALNLLLDKGKIGENYNIGGNNELSNLELVALIIKCFPEGYGINKCDWSSHIEYVEDRKGHDFRYSINYDKLNLETGWTPSVNFENQIRNTIGWYLG